MPASTDEDDKYDYCLGCGVKPHQVCGGPLSCGHEPGDSFLPNKEEDAAYYEEIIAIMKKAI